MAAQSTKELLAQLSQNLPQHLAIEVEERSVKPQERLKKTEKIIPPPVVGEKRGGLILRLPRMARDEPIKREEPLQTPLLSQPTTPSEPKVEEKPKKKINWLDMIPSLEEMEKRAEEERNRPKLPKGDPMDLHFIPVGNGEVIRALPYLENTTGIPDFIKYKYPDPARFYAETSRFHRNRSKNA